MKYFLSILISLFAWETLRFGHWPAALAFQSFEEQLVLLLILLVGISFCVVIILLRSHDSGNSGPQQLSTLEKYSQNLITPKSDDPTVKSGSNQKSKT